MKTLIFEQRSLHFHFALSLANYVAGGDGGEGRGSWLVFSLENLVPSPTPFSSTYSLYVVTHTHPSPPLSPLCPFPWWGIQEGLDHTEPSAARRNQQNLETCLAWKPPWGQLLLPGPAGPATRIPIL